MLFITLGSHLISITIYCFVIPQSDESAESETCRVIATATQVIFFPGEIERERERKQPRDSTWKKSPLNRKMGELRVIVCVSLPAVDSTTLVFLSFPFLFQCLPICSGTLGLHALYSAVRSAEM